MTWQRAVVIGASGGIGGALVDALRQRGTEVTPLARSASDPALRIDLEDEQSIAAAAGRVAAVGPVDLVLVASGALTIDGHGPEKTWRALAGEPLAKSFAVNTIGPALVARHFLPLLPRDRRAAFAVLGARVGSIGDNRLGGWYGYRAAKAALAMIVRTLAIEVARTHPQAVCVALHPGTVATDLSQPFRPGGPGDDVMTPTRSTAELLDVLDAIGPERSGEHIDWQGRTIVP